MPVVASSTPIQVSSGGPGRITVLIQDVPEQVLRHISRFSTIENGTKHHIRILWYCSMISTIYSTFQQSTPRKSKLSIEIMVQDPKVLGKDSRWVL